MPQTYTTLAALFTAVADALRARTGDTAAIPARSFPAAIAALPSGTDTSDATAAAGDILSGKTAYAGGAKLTGTIPSLAAATITPGTAAQTLAAGQYLAGAQTVAGDANLTAANIRSGVSIFGVAGSLSGGGTVEPLHRNVSSGYVAGSVWFPSGEQGLASDVYPLVSGHHYQVGLGSPVGNRFRVACFADDPAAAAGQLSGTGLIDQDSATAYISRYGPWTASADGYLAVFKGNHGNGDAAVSWLLDMDALT